ncbi:hypothetical protein E8E11_008473 [Didymella keratinophila]|nr:hypothetical protein E8E11_008473 [Didymella keratinophila]
MRFLSRFNSHITTGNTIRDLLCAHNRETLNLLRDSYDFDTGMGAWLKTLGLKETLKMQMDQSHSQSELIQHNIQKIGDVLEGGIEKILKSTVNRGPQRPRGAAKTESNTAHLESTDPIEEDGQSYDLNKADSEPAKTCEEDRKGFGPDDPEFLVWLRQFGGRKGGAADTPPHPQSATEAEPQQKSEEPIAQDANQEQPASIPAAEEKPNKV